MLKVANSVGRAMVLKGGRDPVFLFVEEQSCFRAERVLSGDTWRNRVEIAAYIMR